MDKTEVIVSILSVITAILTLVVIILKLIKAYNGNSSDNDPDPGEESTMYTNQGANNINSDQNINVSGDVNGSINIATPSTFDETNLSREYLPLKQRYTSSYAEQGKIHSEKITIHSVTSGKVEGTIFLDDNHSYRLVGTFKNRVLTGEFTSTGRYVDERGTINLKLITENVLSGFCSFSKMSTLDQIKTSPYVWVAGDNIDLVNGTYEFCTHCHNEGLKCCCASPDIDMPVLLYNEALKLQSSVPRSRKMNTFSRPISKSDIRQMNALSTDVFPTYCHFFDISENKCKIYDIRPTDCRLFPFDIKFVEGKKDYMVGYYTNLCEKQLPDKEVMKIYAHILRPQLFLLYPFASAINQESVCQKLKDASFEEIEKASDFLF